MHDDTQAADVPDDSQAREEPQEILKELRKQIDFMKAQWGERDTKWGEQDTALARALQERDAAIAAQHTLGDRQRQLEDTAISAYRRALLAEHAGEVVEELVQGGTLGELEASVTAARDAYGRIAERVRVQAAASGPTDTSPRLEPIPEEMRPLEKITNALARSRQ